MEFINLSLRLLSLYMFCVAIMSDNPDKTRKNGICAMYLLTMSLVN
jgi:hypothetical protein